MRAKRHTSELNAEHSHFILLDEITDLKQAMALRYKIEERLLTPIGRGKKYRKMLNLSDPNLSMLLLMLLILLLKCLASVQQFLFARTLHFHTRMLAMKL